MSTNIIHFHNTLPNYIREISREYSKPLIHNRFFEHRKYIKKHDRNKLIEFNNNRWIRRPWLFCIDEYGGANQYLYPVILTINGINSIHNFLRDNFNEFRIIAPNIDVIKSVLRM